MSPSATDTAAMLGLDSPAQTMLRLQAIEQDLANRQNEYEHATDQWYRAQREIGKTYATALLASSEKSVTAQKAEADLAAAGVPGTDECEAEYKALKAVIDVMDKRAMILMALLKSQGRIQ